MTIHSVTIWDYAFFTDLVNYRNGINSQNESVQFLEGMLGPHAPFNRNNNWRCWLERDESNEVVGSIFASFSSNQETPFMPIGYFDSENDGSHLFREVEKWAIENGFREIRGPINGNIFNGSRLRLPTSNPLFFGEPVNRKHYPDLFLKNEFTARTYWYSYKVGWLSSMLTFLFYLFKCFGQKTKTRSVDLKKWDEEIKIIYELLMDAYGNFEDMTPITFDEFKYWNNSLKNIINPKHALIAEMNGIPIGFFIGVRDKNETGKDRFLALHIGKKKNLEGKVKRVAAKLYVRIVLNTLFFLNLSPFACFISENSPTFRYFSKTKYQEYARYTIFKKIVS